MIENILEEKYGEYLEGLDIYENKTSLKLSRIVIKPEFRQTGLGSKIMEDLVNYADQNKKIIALKRAKSNLHFVKKLFAWHKIENEIFTAKFIERT